MAALALAARLASAALATAAVRFLPSLDGAGPLTFSADPPRPPSPPFLTALTAWDGAFFAQAASGGGGQHDAATCAFGPWTGRIAGRAAARLAAGAIHPAAAALGASWVAFLGAAVALDAAAGVYLPGPSNRAARTLAALLFALSPAGPFVTGLYAEAWHALWLAAGLLLAAKGAPWASAGALALATAARSTGVVGAVLWAAATPGSARPRCFAAESASRAGRAALAASPLLAWQAAAWRTFCVRRDGSAAPSPPWCASRVTLPGLGGGVARLPLPCLVAVQARDWGVGPGRYWRASNAPHFALAAPAIVIALGGLVHGGMADPPGGVGVPAWAIHAHTAALTLLVTSTAHVQIATRLLALGAPGWVWCAAAAASGAAVRGRKAWLPPRWLWLYALGYGAVGGVLHATWFPWT